MSLENIIEPSYIVKNGLNQEFYDYLAGQLGKRLKSCGNKVPVVTGKSSPSSIKKIVFLITISHFLQATLALSLAPYSPKSVAAIPTSVVLSVPSVLTQRNSRFGKK